MDRVLGNECDLNTLYLYKNYTMKPTKICKNRGQCIRKSNRGDEFHQSTIYA
jgi:hypothetical protein